MIDKKYFDWPERIFCFKDGCGTPYSNTFSDDGNENDKQYVRSDIHESVKDALRDILKAITTPDNGVSDTIWVDKTPIGDFIQCVLDEEIEFDELQGQPFRCKKTPDMEYTQKIDDLKSMCETLATAAKAAIDCWPHDCVDEGQSLTYIKIREALTAYAKLKEGVK